MVECDEHHRAAMKEIRGVHILHELAEIIAKRDRKIAELKAGQRVNHDDQIIEMLHKQLSCIKGAWQSECDNPSGHFEDRRVFYDIFETQGDQP